MVVIGAGILGLATARALTARHPDRRVTVIDKEPAPARHQSGHNSGVLHSGIYYRPGSQKARLCGSGREQLEAYCAAKGVPFERCGKVIVATHPNELAALATLRERAIANGLDVTPLDRAGLAEHEPHADGLAALFVPATGVIDFGEVCERLVDDLVGAGVRMSLGREVVALREDSTEVVVDTTDGVVHAARVVNCGGLHGDLIARRTGLTPSVRIVPFRGEYATLVDERSYLVRHLIYPVPDPRFPFLGVHLTRGIDGRVHVGPNAVLALAREGYRRGDVSARQLARLATDRSVWRLARRYWRTGRARDQPVGQPVSSAGRRAPPRPRDRARRPRAVHPCRRPGPGRRLGRNPRGRLRHRHHRSHGARAQRPVTRGHRVVGARCVDRRRGRSGFRRAGARRVGPAGSVRTMAAADDALREQLEALGQFIRAQRLQAQLSLRDLAARTNVSNPYLSQLERGLHEPSMRVLKSIAGALNVPVDALLARAGLLSDEDGDRTAATERAILADERLTDDQRRALLEVYRSYLGSNARTD